MNTTNIVFPKDTLIDMGRAFRPPVDKWASRALERLDKYKTITEFTQIEEMSVLLNWVGLLYVCAGRQDLAEELCIRHIARLHSLSSTFGMTAVASLAVQPWVNIGRLLRIRNEPDRALEYFRSIYARSQDGKLTFSRFSIRYADIIGENIENLYVFDTLKTYLQCGRLDEASTFCARMRQAIKSRGARAILTELELKTSFLAGDNRSASDILKRDAWFIDRHGILVNALYRIVLAHLITGKENSRDAIVSMAKKLSQCVVGVNEIEHRYLRFALALSTYLVAIGADDLGSHISLLGYRGSTAYDDVPLRAAFSKLLDAGPSAHEVEVEKCEAIVLNGRQPRLANQYGVNIAPDNRTTDMLRTLWFNLGQHV